MAHNPMGTDPSDSQNHAIFNATTQTRNVVDPRTGLFEVYVKLPSITGNNGNGPVLDMSLFYTPVVNNTSALGDGWSFGCFSSYSASHEVLTLHTGEKLPLKPGFDLETPVVIAVWDNDDLILSRKGGRQEVLSEVMETGVYLPYSLTSDGFNTVTLEWKTTPQEVGSLIYHQIQLTDISDANRQLFKAEYTATPDEETPDITAATITFWPEDAVETLVYKLDIKDYALQSITLAAGEIETTFKYLDHVNVGWLLTTINTFDGVTEQVVYLDNGLQFPDNPKLSALPCVSTHTLTPNGGGTPVITKYSYQRQDPTHYTTTMSVGVPAIRTTVYNYNEKHEMTQEVLTQGSAVTQTDITTTRLDGRLDYSTAVTYKTNNQHRIASISNTYNSNSAVTGNAQDGANISWDYSSESLLTPSPGEVKLATTLGIIGVGTLLTRLANILKGDGLITGKFPSTYLSTEFVAPGQSSASTRFTYNSYTKIDGLTDALLAGSLQWVVGTGSVLQAALVGVQITYFENDPVRNGRQKSITRSSRDRLTYLETAKDSVQSFDYILNGLLDSEATELTTKTTETDAPGNKRISSQTHSILSGRLINQEDADGNLTLYTYDAYARLKTLTTCAQSTTYQKVTTYDYPAPGQVQITEPSGRVLLWVGDGQNNVTQEYVVENNENILVKETTFDRIGRELRTTQYDYADDGSQLSNWYELKYDDWNQISSRLYSDGHEEFNQYDPIAMKRREWTGLEGDHHGKVTSYNLDETIKTVEWLDEAGNTFKTETSTYTSAKLRSQLAVKDEFGSKTINYTYDAIGRLLRESHVEKDAGSLVNTSAYSYYYTYPAHWLVNEAARVEFQNDLVVGAVRRTLGTQTFDSAWRVTSLTRGGVTETYSYTGGSRVPTSKTTAEGTVLQYQYIKELGNRLSKVSKVGESKTFTYAYGDQFVSSATEGQHFLEYTQDINSHLTQQTVQTAPGLNNQLLSNYSFGGRLLNETDPTNTVTTFSYASNGQRVESSSDDLTTTYGYDNQGKLIDEDISQAFGSPSIPITLRVERTYDSQQRETSRFFEIPGHLSVQLLSTYYPGGNLKRTELNSGPRQLGSRSFTYNAGGRLKSCTTSGVCRPKNPQGKAIDRQDFTYDGLGNVFSCITTFGTAKNTCNYSYAAALGYRLVRIQNTHADYPASANLTYDTSGRITQDQTGKKYTYDWLGRLIQVGSTYYAYDPADRLMTRTQGAEQAQIVYGGREVRGEYDPGATDKTRNMSPGSDACTIQHIKRSGVNRVLYELRDAFGTVLASYDWVAESIKYHAYTPYGEHVSDEADSLLGFNGQYRDTSTDQYPLGLGYRWYDPACMQFHVQDIISPFDEGGPHPYGYCTAGDPVNYQDPSGHLNVSAQLSKIWGDSLPAPLSLGSDTTLINTILWSGIGVLTAIMTGGTSLLLTGCLVVLAIASAATAITSVLIAETNPDLSEKLAWLSLGLGVFGAAAQLTAKVVKLGAYLARSGTVVARSLFARATGSTATTLNRLNLFKLRETVLGGFIAKVDARVTQLFSSNAKSLLQPRGVTSLFDISDVNTVTFITTGAFGIVGTWQSEEAQFINTGVGDQTWLPWGSFSELWLKSRGR